jgi:hypothetical protein
MDVEASRAIRQSEVGASQTMIERNVLAELFAIRQRRGRDAELLTHSSVDVGSGSRVPI